MEDKIEYLVTDDTLDVGKESKVHTNQEAKEYHEKIMRNKKEFLNNFKTKK